jgi:hypothetical protein
MINFAAVLCVCCFGVIFCYLYSLTAESAEISRRRTLQPCETFILKLLTWQVIGYEVSRLTVSNTELQGVKGGHSEEGRGDSVCVRLCVVWDRRDGTGTNRPEGHVPPGGSSHSVFCFSLSFIFSFFLSFFPFVFCYSSDFFILFPSTSSSMLIPIVFRFLLLQLLSSCCSQTATLPVSVV